MNISHMFNYIAGSSEFHWANLACVRLDTGVSSFMDSQISFCICAEITMWTSKILCFSVNGAMITGRAYCFECFSTNLKSDFLIKTIIFKRNSKKVLASQMYGRSPVCALKWMVNAFLTANRLSHSGHGNGFLRAVSPMCLYNICWRTLRLVENTAVQISHRYWRVAFELGSAFCLSEFASSIFGVSPSFSGSNSSVLQFS